MIYFYFTDLAAPITRFQRQYLFYFFRAIGNRSVPLSGFSLLAYVSRFFWVFVPPSPRCLKLPRWIVSVFFFCPFPPFFSMSMVTITALLSVPFGMFSPVAASTNPIEKSLSFAQCHIVSCKQILRCLSNSSRSFSGKCFVLQCCPCVVVPRLCLSVPHLQTHPGNMMQ